MSVLFRARVMSRRANCKVGAWLSLVEHSVRDRGVGGSNPLAPTTKIATKQEALATGPLRAYGGARHDVSGSVARWRHASLQLPTRCHALPATMWRRRGYSRDPE